MSQNDPPLPILASPSNYILPLGLRSRRGSLASLASSTQDKEQLGKALDAIHTTASRTGTLTTFNEFASPPPAASSSVENKGLAGELMQNGLSGLYSRFKGAVVGGKSSSPLAQDDGHGGESTNRTSQRHNGSALRNSVGSGRDRTLLGTPSSDTSSPSRVRSPAMKPRPVDMLSLAKTSDRPRVSLSPESHQTKTSTAHANMSPTGLRRTPQLRPGSPEIILSDADSQVSSLLPAPGDNRTKTRNNPAGRISISYDEEMEQEESGYATPMIDGRSDISSQDGHGDSVKKPRDVSPKVGSNISLLRDQNIPRLSLDTANLSPRTETRGRMTSKITANHLPGFDVSRDTSREGGAAVLNPVNTSAHGQVDHGSFSGPAGDATRTRNSERSPRRDHATHEVASTKLERMRKQVLSKEFWMADEICKECFLCGDTFTAFRRKHHCRTCGCIFDSKCMSTVPGERFGVQSTLRVCRTCLDIINRRHDSSGSDESGDDGFVPTSFFPSRAQQARRPAPNLSPTSQKQKQGDLESNSKSSVDIASRAMATPMMAIPAARRIGDHTNKRSAILEIDTPQSIRPSSARSVKSANAVRPPSSGHRRNQSKHNLLHRIRGIADQRAPFQKDPGEERKRSKLSAFHDDNIIDPDLALYMSDEASTDDEQMSLFGALNGDTVTSPNYENERAAFGSLLSAGKRARRTGERTGSVVSFANRGTDDAHGLATHARPNRRRNLSASSNMVQHGRGSPRHGKTGSTVAGIADDTIRRPGSPFDPPSVRGPTKMTRSISMQNVNETAVELNHASLRHVKRLLHQMLEDYNIPNIHSWEKALLPILLRCTDDVNPDVRAGDAIDIRHYVKIKKIPGGRPGDTAYISGVVFTKNLALKSMPRSIAYPRIVLISFAIEYAKKQQHFMSIEPVIAQEADFLKNMVARIVSLRPHLVLVQKNISGLALQYLQEANVAVAYNVKQSVMEAVSRFTCTEIISSIDMVALKPVHVGKSAGFDVKTYVHRDISGMKKTCMQISGCPKELGCTIVLRGASTAVLSKMKRITEFMVYVVYNLKLETHLMRDEFVVMPPVESDGDVLSSPKRAVLYEPGQHNSDIPDGEVFEGIAEASKRLHNLQQLDTTVASGFSSDSHTPMATPACELRRNMLDDFKSVDAHHTKELAVTQSISHIPSGDPHMPTFYSDMVAKHETKILSASPFVKFMQPYLLNKAREQERRLDELRTLRDQYRQEESNENEKTAPARFQLILPEMMSGPSVGTSRSIKEVLHAVHDAEYDKALYAYQKQKRQWENYLQGSVNLFDPYSHQNLVVLYTVVCTTTTVPCAGPDIIAFAFYNEAHELREWHPDCTLGQFVEDLCLRIDDVCESNGCERKMSDHHRTYVHGEARITVFLDRTPSKIKGLQDSILMWSYCKICEKETQVMPMSESTWKYSFGKYLELSFWSSEVHLRPTFCPHDLHRDHIRYFGYNNVAMRIHYDPIDLLEIIVPRSRVTWKVENDLRLKNEIFLKAEERWSRFMISVQSRIKGINIDSVAAEKTEACKAEVERLTKRAQDEHALLIKKLQEKYMDSKYYEIVPLNRAVRAMQEKVAQWDNAFADFDADYFPTEKDIRRLAALQLRKMFMDSNSSAASLVSTVSDTESKSVELNAMSSPHVEESLRSVVEHDNDSNISAMETAIDDYEGTPIAEKLQAIDHLDLAVHSGVGQRSRSSSAAMSMAKPESTVNGDVPLSGLPSEKEDEIDEDVDKATTLTVSPMSPSSPSLRSDDILDESLLPTPTQKSISEGLTRGFQESLTPNGSSEASLTEKILQFRTQNKADATLLESSGIPRPNDSGNLRRSGSTVSPALTRAQSQPTGAIRRPPAVPGKTYIPRIEKSRLPTPSDELPDPFSLIVPELKDRRLKERLGLKSERKGGSSMIPRSVGSRRKESKVSTLAKHFEQLSREFEKERLRDRRSRAAKSSQSRAFPKAFAKPIVDVYKDVHEAVEEVGQNDDFVQSVDSLPVNGEEANDVEEPADVRGDTSRPPSPTSTADIEAEETEAETSAETETGDERANASHPPSDDEDDVSTSFPALPELGEIAERIIGTGHGTEIDIPKHEKMSYMQKLSSFWAERSASGWTALEYPLNATDHVFVDSDVIVREDEPSSLIAFALSTEDYINKLHLIRDQGHIPGKEKASRESDQYPMTEPAFGDIDQAELDQSLLRPTGTHFKYQFAEGSAKMLCKIFYAEQFDAIRRSCGVGDRIIESLSRCAKWDSKGGKTKSVFLKTLDDRLVLKSLSPIETQAFLRFAPAYFVLMSQALFHDLPTAIAKMLGFYQIVIKNPVTGTEIKWDLLVMENLFYDRSGCRTFDLKGSMRNRKIQSTGQSDEVLLDENMVEYVYENPLFAREHSKKLLAQSVWNDTLFLARQNVMDYSLMVAVDEDRKELVVGVIDCIRTYTWDKKLETWIKDRGFAGGNRNRPTVTSPREYKSRFRAAMSRYILQAPNCWHQFDNARMEQQPRAAVDEDNAAANEKRERD